MLQKGKLYKFVAKNVFLFAGLPFDHPAIPPFHSHWPCVVSHHAEGGYQCAEF